MQSPEQKALKITVTIADLLILNALFATMAIAHAERAFSGGWEETACCISLAYLATHWTGNPFRHSISRYTLFLVLLAAALLVTGITVYSYPFFISYFLLLEVVRILFRSALTHTLRRYHKDKQNQVLYVGSCKALEKLYLKMKHCPTGKYNVLGYFDRQPNCLFPANCNYLGTPDRLTDYLSTHRVSHLYYNTSTAEAMQIKRWCESYSIPCYGLLQPACDTTSQLAVRLDNHHPTVYVKPHPLSLWKNRLVKRSFDVMFALAVLCLLFPFVYVVVAIDMLCRKQRPIIVRKPFVGKDGKVFYSYRFKQTPRWNAIQAFPSFINVLLGDMSVVGPKPHTCPEAKDYEQHILKSEKHYYLRPGITGWAQIKGYLGNSEKLKDMEGNIKADLWYLEHWCFLTDLYIIYRTMGMIVCKARND